MRKAIRLSSRRPEECVQVGKITFGPVTLGQLHVTRGRWSPPSTHDLYQAQYCLGKNEQTCDHGNGHFANRAYKPTAKVLLTRIDKGGTDMTTL